jgi:hypothetical protein
MVVRVTGKTPGVGHDIIQFLNTVADHFQVAIVVTSGYRDSNAQAQAMFNNWLKLERGKVYKKATLPDDDRKTLDRFYDLAHDVKGMLTERQGAKHGFLALATKTVGTRTKHASGRAVDVARAGISPTVHAAITWRMKEVHEGKRHDIHHFESVHIIPAVSEADRKHWPHDMPHGPQPVTHLHRPTPLHHHHHSRHLHVLLHNDLPCVC